MARLTFLFSLISAALFTLPLVHAAPLEGTTEALSPAARNVLLSTRDVTAAPRWVAYFDKWVSDTSLPTVSDLSGFNVFALAFIFSSSYTDNVAVWAGLDAATRASIKAEYEAAGISLVVSAFGSTYLPTTVGDDPTAAANYIANFVTEYGLDGVDVDYEDFTAVETAGTAVAWLTTFTTALRAKLPAGQYILTHAPVAPWFSPGLWADDAYLGVDSAVGSLIDWYNIQFYNQGATEYTTCDGLLTTSSSAWPESAVFQIAANGVSLNKLVIGKPATTADAGSGYMDPATLSTCLVQAVAQGWSQCRCDDMAVPEWRQCVDHRGEGRRFPYWCSGCDHVYGHDHDFDVHDHHVDGQNHVDVYVHDLHVHNYVDVPSHHHLHHHHAHAYVHIPNQHQYQHFHRYQLFRRRRLGRQRHVPIWRNRYIQARFIMSNLSHAEAHHVGSGSLWTATEWNYDEVPGGSANAWQKTATC
ncbi:Glycoside hydrolase [Mycena sanguinolenta]|uniref:Glycoside hydrolase n=1 Tax=Mycena sanguinolenta TaxID=230812 RepID=A0A8H6ZFN8_9AGAR|nr:Glycoside hydrolase [Mycena sanguinolenta]